jgi:transmembrane sensor
MSFKQMETKHNINWALFRKAVNNTLSPEEQAIFNQWLSSELKNKSYFDKAKSFYSTRTDETDLIEPDAGMAFAEFVDYTRHKKNFRWHYIGLAAGILLIVSFSVFLFNSKTPPENSISEAISIEPGKPKAILTISNGKKIMMNELDSILTLTDSESVIEIDSSGIKYEGITDKALISPAINILEVPHGGEFRLTLADGTKVWLNSESRLEYPVKFTEKTREVKLTGEGYFEVAQNKEKPFIVHSGSFDVKVLGTSFNISSFADDNQQVLTLAEGKVEIDHILGIPGKKYDVIPNQQFIFEKNTLSTEIKAVDADVYSAWTRGNFAFDNESIEQLFIKLERWYDVKVFYQNDPIRKEKLTGTLPRFEDFGTILKLINQVSDVEFEVKENTIIIK